MFTLGGREAEHTIRRVLAYQHVTGASAPMVKTAASMIENAGSAQAYADSVADQGVTLWRLGRERSIALEIAVNETVRVEDPEP